MGRLGGALSSGTVSRRVPTQITTGHSEQFLGEDPGVPIDMAKTGIQREWAMSRNP